MKCKQCAHPFVGDYKGDAEMAEQGYRSCAAARTPLERARYIAAATECLYPERFKAKEKRND